MKKSRPIRKKRNAARKPAARTGKKKLPKPPIANYPGSVPEILLRHCPPAIYEKIGQMKVEILRTNKFRGKVSNEQAIYKLIERCGDL